jgi:RNA polymerase sigma-70 factor (ECF subfamily)
LRLFSAHQLNDSAGAEDVTQEVLRLVIEAIRANRIDNQEALPGFVFQTARNVCMHWVRSKLREQSAFARYERESTEEASGSDALENLVSAERAQEVKRALERLHPDDRELLAMIYYDEFDTAEIARRYHITPAALRVRKHRALQRLSAELELGGNEFGQAGTL